MKPIYILLAAPSYQNLRLSLIPKSMYVRTQANNYVHMQANNVYRHVHTQTRYLKNLPLCHESEAKIFLATVNCRHLIIAIAANNVYVWSHSHLLRCTRMDIYANQSCIKIHSFLVCRATTIHAIHVAPGNQRRLAARTGIICGRCLTVCFRRKKVGHGLSFSEFKNRVAFKPTHFTERSIPISSNSVFQVRQIPCQ